MRSMAMSQRNLRCGCGPKSGGDAWNDFKFDVGFAQSCDFFADAAEDQRIAAFEPDDLQSRARQSDHEKVNLVLADVLFAAALADVTDVRVSWRDTEYLFPHQFVVQNHVCVFQYPSSFECK